MLSRIGEEHEGVWVISLATDEHEDNRLTVPLLEALMAALEVAVNSGARLIVTWGGAGRRHYSNGVDLDLSSSSSPQLILSHLVAVCHRLLTLSVPTVAFLSGHAFGGGLLLALAHDFRVAFPQKGYFCVPAVGLGIDLPQSLVQLAVSKLPPNQLATVLLAGKRFGGQEALKMGVADVCISPDGGDVLEKVIHWSLKHVARNVSTRPVYGRLKAAILQARGFTSKL